MNLPLYTADALILRTYKLGEADRIVVFLTRDRGKKRGVAKGARRPRSRFAAALEPMTEVRLAYFEKESRELVGLNYAEMVRSPLTLAMRADGPPEGGPHRGSLADALGHIGYFAELLDRLGASMLDALTAGAPVQPLARYFEYWLLRLQGVYPEAQGTLSDAAMGFLAASRTVPPMQVGDVPVPLSVLKELEQLHRGLISMHLEKNLKSDRVLRDLRRYN